MEEKPDSKPFDTAMKQLAGGSPQAWVSYLLRGVAVFKQDLNRELMTRKVEADTLFDVEWDGEPIILHIEFQRNRHSDMPKRVWEYNMLARIGADKPVYSIVIYPIEIPSITESKYMFDFRNGHNVGWFTFDQIKLWEIEPEEFEKPHLTGLLPLLPLTKNGQNHETVERMLRDMQLAGVGKEAYSMGELVAGLVLTSEQDKQWLNVRFQIMSNIIEESWVYQDILQKGEQRGLLRYMERRFPSLLALAKSVIEPGMSLQQFQALADKLYSATTIEEASAALQDA